MTLGSPLANPQTALGANVAQSFTGSGVLGGGSQFGGGTLTSPSDRYGEMARRGGAPLTIGGLLAAAGNAMAVGDPLRAAMQTALSSATGLNLGGFQNIPGQYAIPGNPQTLAAYNAARAAAEREANAPAGHQTGLGDKGPMAGKGGQAANAGF